MSYEPIDTRGVTRAREKLLNLYNTIALTEKMAHFKRLVLYHNILFYSYNLIILFLSKNNLRRKFRRNYFGGDSQRVQIFDDFFISIIDNNSNNNSLELIL